MRPIDSIIIKANNNKSRQGLDRKVRIRGGDASFDGKDCINFASNDYLGLSTHPDVIQAAAVAAAKYGTGSGASRLVTGTLECHISFEKQLAEFKGKQGALLFGSGYLANIGTIPAMSRLFGDGCVILCDELNHASILDGCKLSKIPFVTYRHNDMSDLAGKAALYKGGVIVSDAVFSMDGDIVDLPGLMSIADTYGYLTIIDEAPSTGVLGASGRGITEQYDCPKPDIIMGTCSKSLAGEGGYICANYDIIQYLTNNARSFIFSTASSPITAAASSAALSLLIKSPSLVAQLRSNIDIFAQSMRVSAPTAIIPIHIGSEKNAVEVSKLLLDRGYYAPAIRFPTVAYNKARLRVTMSAKHNKTHILGLTKTLKEIL